MIAEVSLTDESLAAEIHAVALVAYAVEAALIGCADFPPLRESLSDLRRSPDRFLVFRKSGAVAGVLSFSRDDDTVCVTRLVVRPSDQRQGIATALLADLGRSCAETPRFAVSTAQANVPAIRLYERLGYAVVSTSTSREGIALVHLEMKMPRENAITKGP